MLNIQRGQQARHGRRAHQCFRRCRSLLRLRLANGWSERCRAGLAPAMEWRPTTSHHVSRDNLAAVTPSLCASAPPGLRCDR